MKKRSELMQHLRDHIIGALHVGRLAAGARLPSIRQVAQQYGKNPRTVAAAYRGLAEEGLVELRGRSGVFVASRESPVDEATEELSSWIGNVVTEGWKRRFPAYELPQLCERAVASAPVRCGLVEQIEDGMVAFRHELENDFGFDVDVFDPQDVIAASARPRSRRKGVEQVHRVHFLATTNFYAPGIHTAAKSLGKPLVILTVNAPLEQAIRAALSTGRLTVIACDQRFSERFRVAYDPDRLAQIRFLQADEAALIRDLDPDEPVLLTRAARSRVPAWFRNPLIDSGGTTLSLQSAAALAAILVRTNLTHR